MASMNSAEVRDALDSINVQVTHLHRSQKELLLAVEEGMDDDGELQKAFDENVLVLVKKRARAKEMMGLLEQIDPAYMVENATALKLIRESLELDGLTPDMVEAATRALEALSTSTGPIEIIQNGERQYDAETKILGGGGPKAEEEEGDGGLYL
jgi:hypothetical protein